MLLCFHWTQTVLTWSGRAAGKINGCRVTVGGLDNLRYPLLCLEPALNVADPPCEDTKGVEVGREMVKGPNTHLSIRQLKANQAYHHNSVFVKSYLCWLILFSLANQV